MAEVDGALRYSWYERSLVQNVCLYVQHAGQKDNGQNVGVTRQYIDPYATHMDQEHFRQCVKKQVFGTLPAATYYLSPQPFCHGPGLSGWSPAPGQEYPPPGSQRLKQKKKNFSETWHHAVIAR